MASFSGRGIPQPTFLLYSDLGLLAARDPPGIQTHALQSVVETEVAHLPVELIRRCECNRFCWPAAGRRQFPRAGCTFLLTQRFKSCNGRRPGSPSRGQRSSADPSLLANCLNSSINYSVVTQLLQNLETVGRRTAHLIADLAASARFRLAF